MPWTLELSYANKSGRATLPDWPAVRERIVLALEKFVPHQAKRAMLIQRVTERDAERSHFFVMASAEPRWRIAAQVELNPESWVKGKPIIDKGAV